MSSDHAHRAWNAGLLTLAVLVGLALRLAPLAGGAGGDFISDQAFHLRMIREVVDHGHVPALDRLSDAPAGRPVASLLPVGIYHAAAAFHALLARAGEPSLEAAALGFTALAGALIALPVFLLALALFRDRWAALIAAFAAVVLPAHLHRTFCWWLRYDALGALLALAHLAFLVRALAAAGARRAALEAAAAGLLLALAVACWRVVLILPPLEAAALLLLLLVRGVERPAALAFAVSLGLAALACLPVGYVRAQGLLLSRAWVLPLALATAALTPWARSGAPARLATAAAALVVGWVIGGLAGGAVAYGDVMQIVPARLALLRGVAAQVTPITALLLNVEELGGVRPVELFGPAHLSWLGAWCAGALLLRWLAGGRRAFARPGELRPAPVLFAFLCAALTGATLLFARDKVLLAPLVAVLAGGLASWALGAQTGPAAHPAAGGKRGLAARGPQRGARRGGAPRPAAAWPRVARRGSLVALVLCAAVTLYHSSGLALTRRSRLDPGLAAALGWLRGHTPPGAVVMCPWQQGYEVQSFAGRASVMDGMLEAPGNQRRIVEFAHTAMERGPDSLAAFCRRQHADWLLVPPSTQLLSVALVAGMPFVGKLGPGIPLDREEGDRVLIRMMVLGESPSPFRRVFERGGYRVYRVGPPAAGGAAAAKARSPA